MLKNDNKIKKMLEAVKVKKKALGTKPKPHFRTNMHFTTGGNVINLNILSTRESIMDFLHTLASKELSNERVQSWLSLKVPYPMVSNFTLNDWKQDVMLKLEILNWDEEKKKLSLLEKQLADLRSEEAKTTDAIDDIAESLGV